MPVYTVTRWESSSQHVFIEADSEEQALEAAQQLDSNAWRENQDIEYVHEIQGVATPEELQERIIENANTLLGN